MTWKLSFSNKAAKGTKQLPRREQDVLVRLIQDLQLYGPIQSGWKNFSRLGKDEYHCHLTYKWVACWRVNGTELELLEIYYVGSRENAPY